MQVIQEYVQKLHAHGFYPDEYICHGKEGNLIDIEEPVSQRRLKVLTFCTNDVLGLVQNPRVKQPPLMPLFNMEPPIVPVRR